MGCVFLSVSKEGLNGNIVCLWKVKQCLERKALKDFRHVVISDFQQWESLKAIKTKGRLSLKLRWHSSSFLWCEKIRADQEVAGSQRNVKGKVNYHLETQSLIILKSDDVHCADASSAVSKLVSPVTQRLFFCLSSWDRLVAVICCLSRCISFQCGQAFVFAAMFSGHKNAARVHDTPAKI